MIRVGNASGFSGDRFAAMREMLEAGELDYLTGDYLAELTTLVLAQERARNPEHGYAQTFLAQMEECLGLAVDKGVKIIANAGGVNPHGLAVELRALAQRLGVAADIAFVSGDDLRPRAAELGLGRPLSANAYLGAFGIKAALDAGAEIVVTGRVTDASLTVGPAASAFGWGYDDLDELAGAAVAGHIIEAGAQATGGNYPFFAEIADLKRPGYPIAEIAADGSSVITKHENTGGAVTVGTVTASLLYELDGPDYLGPDVTARLETVTLAEAGPDRIAVTGTRGAPPPDTMKVSVNHLAGQRNELTLVVTGLDIEAKATLFRRQFLDALEHRPETIDWDLSRIDRPDAETEEQASALLRCVARDTDPEVVGERFSRTAVELSLSSYPGFVILGQPGKGAPYGVFEAHYLDPEIVEHRVALPNGVVTRISPSPLRAPVERVPDDSGPADSDVDHGRTVMAPLGTLVGARSGDKGGSATLGVWARDRAHFEWLDQMLSADRLAELLPEVAGRTVHRHRLPNLGALNFVIEGILGRGASDNVRFDPHAKGLGEWLRSRPVPIPEAFLP